MSPILSCSVQGSGVDDEPMWTADRVIHIADGGPSVGFGRCVASTLPISRTINGVHRQ